MLSFKCFGPCARLLLLLRQVSVQLPVEGDGPEETAIESFITLREQKCSLGANWGFRHQPGRQSRREREWKQWGEQEIWGERGVGVIGLYGGSDINSIPSRATN